MDIVLARTFLEIVAAGNFVRAAERLHVTQTAVSVRVQTLEELLGRKLFVRNKAGATLTPAGEQFLRYAPSLVQLWERARQQVAVPRGTQRGRRGFSASMAGVGVQDGLTRFWLTEVTPCQRLCSRGTAIG